MRRLLLSLVLSALILGGAGRASLRAQTTAADAGATITGAYNLLLDDYVNPPEPDQLLQAAWQGALSAAGSGISASLPPLPSDRAGALAAFLPAFDRLVSGAQSDPGALAGASVDAMARSINEQHTYYLTPQQYQRRTELESGSRQSDGLGVRIRGAQPPYSAAPWVVSDVIPDSPADRAGLQPGDTLQTVNGVSAAGVSRSTLLVLLAPAGGSITLGVERPGMGPLQFAVTPGPYTEPNLRARILPGGVGLLRLSEFPSSLVADQSGLRVQQELDADLANFEANGVQYWILDLRNNPGGSVATADHIAGRFLADGVISREFDERGHQAQEIADGHLFPAQRPMAVLINGNSASSSEVIASAMQEYGRALLVGSRTAGALAGNETFPLPNGGALAVTVEEVSSGRYGRAVNDVGVAPDISIDQQPTPEQLASGHDPEVDAAVAALTGTAPPTQTPVASPGALSESDLRSLLAGYGIDAAQVPPTQLVPQPRLIGDTVLTHVNELVTGARDPVALRATDLARGWEGEYDQSFGASPDGPGIAISVDRFADENGATDYVRSNDFPDQLQQVDAPIQLGDQTVAYRGIWVNNGAVALVWRHGNTVFTVSYNTQPGLESFDPVIQVAKAVEARYQSS